MLGTGRADNDGDGGDDTPWYCCLLSVLFLFDVDLHLMISLTEDGAERKADILLNRIKRRIVGIIKHRFRR